MMTVDNDLNITYINNAVRDFLIEVEDDIRKQLPSFKVDSLVGANIDIFHKSPQHQRKMLAALEKPHYTSISISGSIFNLRAFPLFDEKGNRLGSAVEWLPPSQMDNAAQVAAIRNTQAVVEFSLTGHVLDANEKFLQVVGYSLEDLVGKHHSMLLDEKDRTSHEYKSFWDRLAKSGTSLSGRFKRLSAQGKTLWLQASYNPILDLNGRPFKVVKYAYDITEQVQMSENIQSLISNNLSQVTSSVNEVSAKTQSAKENTQEALTNVQAIAVGAEQMGTAIAEIAKSMSRSKDAVTSMAGKTQETNTAAVTLLETANKMSEIVDTITEIAEQTNLLALNATIESARAGDAGKGFSVVASEVKNLAGQVATATKEIKRQIEMLQGRSSDVARTVEDMEKSMSNMQEYISISASAVEEQSSVSREMAANMVSASKSVEHITSNIDEVNRAMSEVETTIFSTIEVANKIV